MKVAVIAGGMGSRMATAATAPPKPLTPVGGRAVIELIIERFAAFGLGPFVVALGHRASEVEAHLKQSPLAAGIVCEDTGEATQNAGRLRRIAHHLGDAPFLLAWCDGLSDVDFDAVVQFHETHGKLVTLVAAHPTSALGIVDLEGDRVRQFDEKPVLTSVWANAGYFVVDPKVFSRIADDDWRWEQDVLSELTREGELMAYRHHGFWRCMDTPRDAETLNEICAAGKAPWADGF